MKFRIAIASVLISAAFIPGALAQVPADPPPPPGAQQGAPLLSPQQLDNLVAPVALYPDPLLGQVLAASTYPVEITEAQQWLQQNSGLQGDQLMQAARQQNWDASVQALVAFPDALKLLSSNIRWTTDLGNAFLAQQADVMAAVQRMRESARNNGRLASNSQQIVTDEMQGGQSAIEIQPSNPQVIYVPVYNPMYVWGPPIAGYYPDLWYSDWYGYGFGPGIYVSTLFPGWGGWGGWGWGCGWFGGGLFVNAGFFHRYGFHGGWYDRGGYRGGFRGGREAWAHDPGHRWGTPYPNRTVASRFNSNRFVGATSRGFPGNTSRGFANGFAGNNRGFAGNNRGFAGNNGWQRFNGRPSGGSTYGGSAYAGRGAYGAYGAQGYRSSPYSGYSGSYRQGYAGSRYATPQYSRPQYSAPRFSAPQYSAPRYSTPRFSAPAYSAPRSFGGGRSGFSAPSYSAPHYGGGFSGGRSYSGGGFSGGHGFSGGFSGGHSGGFSGGHSGGFSGGHSGGFSGGHSGGFSGGRGRR